MNALINLKCSIIRAKNAAKIYDNIAANIAAKLTNEKKPKLSIKL